VLGAPRSGCDESPEILNELAWPLATVPNISLRDGSRAVALANRSIAAMPNQPLVLDTLAAALAEKGEFA
jgi:hypothetical protein